MPRRLFLLLTAVWLPAAVSLLAQTPSPQTSFPSPAASGTRLVVPEGDQVASYTGI